MNRWTTHFAMALAAALTALTGSVAWGQVSYQRSDAMWQAPVPYNVGQIQLVSNNAFDGETPGAPSQEGCDDTCADPDCCGTTWRVFGDYLLLRPVNAQVEYGVPIDGTIAPPPAVPVQIGRTGIVDPDYSSGYRVGFARCLDNCTEFVVTFASFESQTADQISTTAPNVIRSMVSHPSTFNASSDFLRADADYGIDFQLADFDWHRRIWTGEQTTLNILGGFRYAHMDQNFQAVFANLGTETVQSDVKFDGGGLRVGIDGDWQACNSGFMVYGRAVANIVTGKTRAQYIQQQSFDPTVVNTVWEADRLTSILELELGIGWIGCGERFRAKAGYMISTWHDTVTVNDYIDSVQTNDYRGLGDSLSFDGLVAGAEYSF